MKKRIKQIVVLFVLCLFAASLLSCSAQEQAAPPNVSAFFDALGIRDYSYCYSSLSDEVKQDMTLSEFVTRYETIYDAMGLEGVDYEIKVIAYGKESCEAVCSVVYHCEKLGEIEQTITVRLMLDDENEWKIHWQPSMILSQLDWDDKVMVYTLKQKRGEILDSLGNAFAVNSFADTVCIDLSAVGDYGSAARALAGIVSMGEMDIITIMSAERAQTDGVAIITYYVPGTLTQQQREAITAIPGVGIDSSRYTPIRYYPQGSMMAHTLGYATVATAEDLADASDDIYGVDSYIGRSGLEAAYEDVLAGKRGIELVVRKPKERDEAGNPVSYEQKSVVKRIDAVDGIDLCLTIDYTLQKRAEEQLATLTDAQAGSIVVMDPSTGAVLASASAPTFSLNIFADKNIKQLYEALLDNPKAPLYNRVTRGLYPPGSTVKPFVAAMSLDSGLFSVGSEFKGSIYKRQWMPTVDGWVYPAITRVSNYEPPYNMTNAIINSDNIYFANVALTCGWTRVVNLYTSLGFDTSISYDINVARPSVYSDSSWSNLRLLADMGYGQGELLITPIQMASLFEVFANGGKIMRPYIVSELKATQDNRYVTKQVFEPQLWRAGVLTDEAIGKIEHIMIDTIDKSASARISGLTIAGKTGTAQVDNDTEIAWLIAYVKDMGYERLVCVTLEVEPDGGNIRYEMVKSLIMP